MFIGEISQLTGASPKAIRHYESLGLLGKVSRAGSYRVYSSNDVRQVSLIRQAQTLGFRLAELRLVLQDESNEPDWEGLSQQIERKRQSIKHEIDRLRSLDAQLDRINLEIRSCPGGGESMGEACDVAPPLPTVKTS